MRLKSQAALTTWGDIATAATTSDSICWIAWLRRRRSMTLRLRRYTSSTSAKRSGWRARISRGLSPADEGQLRHQALGLVAQLLLDRLPQLAASDLPDDRRRRVFDDGRVGWQVVDRDAGLAPAHAGLVEQDGAEAHLQVAQDGREIAKPFHAARAGGSPEALEGSVGDEAVVLVDQSAQHLALGLGHQQPAIDVHDRGPGVFVRVRDRSAEQLEPCRAVARLAMYEACFLSPGLGTQDFERGSL